MNHEAIIRAAYFFCRALGRPTSRREINAVIARQLGTGFRPQEICAVLAAIKREPLGNQTGTTTGTTLDAQTPPGGNHLAQVREPATLRYGIELDSSLRSSSCDVPTPQAEKATNLKLPFDRPILDLRHAILKAVWRHVEPIIGRSTTWANWRARNARVAEAFARGGFTPEQIERAWELASKDQGENVRELSRIQRYLERVEGAVAMRKGRT